MTCAHSGLSRGSNQRLFGLRLITAVRYLILVHPLVLASFSQADDAETLTLVKAATTPGFFLEGSGWSTAETWIEGQGTEHQLTARYSILPGDFHLKARLRLLDQNRSAATFFLGSNHFGFEGASETLFVNGPLFSGLKFVGDPDDYFPSGSWFTFEAIAAGKSLSFHLNGQRVLDVAYDGQGFDSFGFRPWRAKMQIETCELSARLEQLPEPMQRGYTIPTIDLASETERQVIVDRESGQYLGHPTTVLLEDGRTMLCVYPKGHGRGGIVYKRSTDGGKTWSDRLPTPDNWSTSLEVPTIHRVVDAAGKKRLIMWSGLYPARLAVSEDDGATWSELRKVGDWGGIVVMGFVEKLKTPGHYLAMFHDDGRFFQETPARQNPVEFRLYQVFSTDGGLTWSTPEMVYQDTKIHLCEPGCIRSPDGKQLAVLLRENARRRNSFVIFSNDEGRTWTEPRELPAALTGDRHTGKYLPDGRLFISFRDKTHVSPTAGDWVAWVGRYDDIAAGREGQYRVRLMDNTKGSDCAYPGVEVLNDGTIVTTTYGHWSEGEAPYIVSVRLKLAELDERVKRGDVMKNAP